MSDEETMVVRGTRRREKVWNLAKILCTAEGHSTMQMMFVPSDFGSVIQVPRWVMWIRQAEVLLEFQKHVSGVNDNEGSTPKLE